MTLHNHYPINCLTYESRYCNSYVVKPPLAHLQHWRSHCKNTYCNSKIGATEKCTLDCLNSTYHEIEDEVLHAIPRLSADVIAKLNRDYGIAVAREAVAD